MLPAAEIANKARSAKLKAMADAKARKEEISAEAAEARATAEVQHDNFWELGVCLRLM